VNSSVQTYDPRRNPSVIPFELFPRQEDFLRWLADREANQEEGLAEKSRDVGFTWLCCAYAVHAFLFRDGVAVGFGSRKLELVDRIGDPDSIFEKMRMILRNLPQWQLPKGFDVEKHAGHCRIVNPENGNSITGEGGDNIGRGGRKSFYFVDEAAFLERSQKVEAALSQNTNVRIWVSTPNGTGNTFYKKRFSGKVPVFTFHWKDDPRKDEEWYQKQKRSLDEVTVAQEIDIDYSASIEGIVIPAKWVAASLKLERALADRGLELHRNGKRYAALDVADEGKNLNVFIGRQGSGIFAVESWSHLNTTQTAYKAREFGEKYGIAALGYDCIGVGAGVKGAFASMEDRPSFSAVAVNVGDPPTNTRWEDGKTSKERFRNLKAELWWLARMRFERTFEFIEEGIDHPLDELIALPQDQPELIAQLSQPTYHYTDTGKIQIESKGSLAKRGIASPDFADALVIVAASDQILEPNIALCG
jgi:phage terminase large subunit